MRRNGRYAALFLIQASYYNDRREEAVSNA